MNKILKQCLAAFAVTSLSASMAIAGSAITQEVSVLVVGAGGLASGSVVDARNSADSTQSIGCALLERSDGVSRLSCHATDAAGVSVSCVSFDDTDTIGDTKKAAAGGVNEASWIWFSALSDGTCGLLQVSNSSVYL